MVTTSLELPAIEFDSVKLTSSHAAAEYVYATPTGIVVLSNDGVQTMPISQMIAELKKRTLPSTEQFIRFVATGENTETIEFPLQVVQLPSGPEEQLMMQTPDLVQGLRVSMTVSLSSNHVTVEYSVDFAGLPLAQAVKYARFLLAVNSPGELVIELMEPTTQEMGRIALPVASSPDRKHAVWLVNFCEDLADIDRALNAGLKCPSEVTEEELQQMQRVKEAIEVGWVEERLSSFRLPLDSASLHELLSLHGRMVDGLALKSNRETLELFGSTLDLGRVLRWIKSAQLTTPISELRDWLASVEGDASTVATEWIPMDDSPMHVFYSDWPKLSLEEINESIKELERLHKMSSRKFYKAWKEGRQLATRIDDGEIWSSLIELRDAMR